MRCYFCNKETASDDRIGRRDTCPLCGGDLHICYHCQFYDKSAYNECREPQAERVLEKEKSNFCDYFSPSTTALSGGSDDANDAKKKLEALFKK